MMPEAATELYDLSVGAPQRCGRSADPSPALCVRKGAAALPKPRRCGFCEVAGQVKDAYCGTKLVSQMFWDAEVAGSMQEAPTARAERTKREHLPCTLRSPYRPPHVEGALRSGAQDQLRPVELKTSLGSFAPQYSQANCGPVIDLELHAASAALQQNQLAWARSSP